MYVHTTYISLHTCVCVCARLKILAGHVLWILYSLIIDSLLNATGRQGDPPACAPCKRGAKLSDRHTRTQTIRTDTHAQTQRQQQIERVCHFQFQCSFPFRTLNVAVSVAFVAVFVVAFVWCLFLAIKKWKINKSNANKSGNIFACLPVYYPCYFSFALLIGHSIKSGNTGKTLAPKKWERKICRRSNSNNSSSNAQQVTIQRKPVT